MGDPSIDITGRMPIVPHETAPGVDCCGCIIAAVDGTNVELRCNECGAVLGVVQVDILKSLLGIDAASAMCPPLRRREHVPRLHDHEGVRMPQVRQCRRSRAGDAVGRSQGRHLHLVRDR
jgi:hypothetical protein